MPGNSDPIYSKVGSIGTPVNITAANASSQGGGTIGTDIFLAFTADATNGSFVRDIRALPTASVANTAFAATVCRVFLSTVSSGVTTSANTHLIGEMFVAATTAANSGAAVIPSILPINMALPPGATILVTSHIAPNASTTLKATVTGGNY